MHFRNISIIVTAHNYGRYIEQCIDSLCMQTLKPAEIIIVDDASDDDTKQIIENCLQKYQSIKMIYKKVVFCDAQESRRFGLSLATSDLVLIMDADNYIDLTMLEKMTYSLVEDNVDLVYCDQYVIDEYGVICGNWIARDYSYTRLQRLNFIDMCSLCKRESLKLDFFDKNIKRFQDWDVWLQYLKKSDKKVTYLQEKLIYKREHKKNISSTKEKYLEKCKVMYKNDIITLSYYNNGKDFRKERVFFQCLCNKCRESSIDECFGAFRKKIITLCFYNIFIFTFDKHCDDFSTCDDSACEQILHFENWNQLKCIIFRKDDLHALLNATTTIGDIYNKFLNK